MWRMIWPLLLIILSNVLYNLCTKSIPQNADPFGTLIITYLAGAVITFALFWLHSGSPNFEAHINAASVLLGFAIVGLEAGYVYLYRAGWRISVGSLTANICLAVVRVVIGWAVYHENISLRQVIGAGVCLLGLYLISG